MNRRKNSPALSPREVRHLHATGDAASKAGLPFTAMLTVHLAQIDEATGDPGAYLRRKVINPLGTWFRRRRVPWIGVWVRENYDGPRHEHVHLLLHAPQGQYDALQAAVERWWPTPTGDLRWVYNMPGAVRYLSKQMSPQAHFAVLRRIRRERESRHTGARVAPVLGRRLGQSRQLKQLIANNSTVVRPSRPTAKDEEIHHAV
jgi:hypothetical protein